MKRVTDRSCFRSYLHIFYIEYQRIRELPWIPKQCRLIYPSSVHSLTNNIVSLRGKIRNKKGVLIDSAQFGMW